MPEVVVNNIRISVPIGSEDVVFVCRRPSAKEISKFLSSRYIQKRNKVEARLYEAREAFVNSILVDVENVTFRNAANESLPLNAATILTEADRASWAAQLDVKPSELTWKDMVPLNWKSGVAMYFEDAQSEKEDDEGN
jgi:hypothetical protein